MLNQKLKLNPEIFDADVEMSPIRRGFGEGLLAAAEKDSRIVGLCADLTDSTFMNLFRTRFPERFVEIGVAEQNLAAVASGLAASGKIPFISSYAVFSPGRNWEQIRTTICYNNVPVKIAGSHAGVSVGPDGGSHQALEDIALTRVLPNMIVLSPCDAIEAKKATRAAAESEKPVYIRLAREKTPIMTTEATPFEIGTARIFYDSTTDSGGSAAAGATVGIIATGALLHRAILAARKLREEGVRAAVLNLSTIKPLDENAVLALARKTGVIVTVEEHQIAGGMGSAVAEFLAAHLPVPIEFIGVRDRFGQTGKPDELIEFYQMGVTHITAAARRVLGRR